MKTISFKYPSVLLLTFVVSSCNELSLSSLSEQGRSSASNNPGGNINPDQLVCDPLGTPGQGSSEHGLKASLRYLDSSQPQYSQVQDYITHGHLVDADLYFSQIFVPTRMFNSGFQTQSGSLLKNGNGDTLFEWFSLQFESELRLRPQDQDGLYEFALLADDGAVLWMNQGNGFTKIVDDDALHPTRLGCGTQAIALDHTSKIPLRVDYFQGPQLHIAVTLLWRKVDYSTPTESSCGWTGNDLFFDPVQSINGHYVEQQAYLDLLSRGWAPVDAQNFYLPQGQGSNPCVN